MCGIAGIISRQKRELGHLLEAMLKRIEHRGPDGAGVVIGDECQRAEGIEGLEFSRPFARIALGHVRLAITGDMTEVQPFESCDGTLRLLHNGEIYNYRELAEAHRLDVDLDTISDSELVLRLLEKCYTGDLVAAMESILPQLDGVYALAVSDGETTVLARDRIGVRQLYYREHNGLFAFASEKKALSVLSQDTAGTGSVKPGEMLVVTPLRRHNVPFWSPTSLRSENIIANREEAIERYDRAIRNALRKRLRGRRRVGIIYSGGIDSFLLAYLAQQEGVELTCYTAGRDQGSDDIEWAQETAEQFGFPIRIRRLSLADIEELLPEIMETIEDHSVNQVEVALPVFAAMREAAEAGERVVISGQGADELFGGYPWYRTIAERQGLEEFVARSWEDTFLLYKECLEREDKIAMAHSIELRVPFLDPEVIRVAFAIAPELKIPPSNGSFDKQIHRDYCLSLGIPREIAFRKKQAAQHGANVHSALEMLSRAQNVTEDALAAVGYTPAHNGGEVLGSSSRYGYRYASETLWRPKALVQYYLDSVAAEYGQMSRAWRYRWLKLQDRLGHCVE